MGFLTAVWAAVTGAKTYVLLGALGGIVLLSGFGGYKLANVKYHKLQTEIAQNNLKAANLKLAKISKVLNKDVVQAEIDDKDMQRIQKALERDAKVSKPNDRCFTKPESDRLRRFPKA